jgi:putative hydrolase of the HAD superfamily
MKIDYALIKTVPADASHREFCYRVKKAAMGEYIARVWGGWDEKVQRKFHAREWQEKRPQIILYGDQPIGTIFIFKDEKYLDIEKFYIHPEYQNKGIGSYLLKQVLDDAEKTGLTARLAVLKINPAVSLYRRHGFESVKEDDLFYFKEYKPRAADKPKRKYQAVIFDLFGTLVDIFSRQEYESTLAEMVSILNTPYDAFHDIWVQTAKKRATGVFRNLEENLEYICNELTLSVSDGQLKLARDVRFAYVTRCLTPKREAIKVLSSLKSAGYSIGLISNCSTEPPVIWPQTAFAPLIDVAIFSSTAGIQKPDPRIYHMAATKLSTKPEKCLYIGDGDSNELPGAAQVGMHPVLIRNPDEVSSEIIRDNVKAADWHGTIISSLTEALGLLD